LWKNSIVVWLVPAKKTCQPANRAVTTAMLAGRTNAIEAWTLQPVPGRWSMAPGERRNSGQARAAAKMQPACIASKKPMKYR